MRYNSTQKDRKTPKVLNFHMKRFIILVVLVSTLVPALVFLLNGVFPKVESLAFISKELPLFHAIINAVTTILLVLGYRSIRNKKIKQHRAFMGLSFVFSTIFLVSYVISKLGTDPVPFGGNGWVAGVYYFILITHITLSAIILPMVLFAVYFALTAQYKKHRRLSKITLPIWLYVTTTGVLVYLFMRPYY